MAAAPDTPMPDDFLAQLDPATANALRNRGTACRYARGQTLMHHRQVPDRVVLLRSGCVKVIVFTDAGREVVLGFRGPGELIGEQSALDGQPRSASVVATEPVEALVFTHTAFLAFLEGHPRAALVLLGCLSRRLREADTHRIEFQSLTTFGRVIKRLLELTDQQGDRVRISQEELAGSVSASLESVGRALQTMRELKTVETGRREIRVVNRDKLASLLGPAP